MFVNVQIHLNPLLSSSAIITFKTRAIVRMVTQMYGMVTQVQGTIVRVNEMVIHMDEMILPRQKSR